MRTPKDLDFYDGCVTCYPAEFDDHGGGSPGIFVDGFLYNVEDLDKLIKSLKSRRKWLKAQNNKYGTIKCKLGKNKNSVKLD